MKDKSQEMVLVIPTSVLHDAGLFQGFSPRADHYLPYLLDGKHLSFLPRGLAEDDPSFKQIIPYVVLRWRDQVFHYTRGQGATEKRLRALRSVGVGGHINPTDQGHDPYRAGLLREVAEEVFLESSYEDRCLGLINDDATAVGRVHLGIVHVFDLSEPKVRRREQELIRSGFAPIHELRQRADEFETWSQFVLNHLAPGDSPGAK